MPVRPKPLAVGLLLLFGGAALAAEPVLRVRARTRIDLEAVERVAGGIVVRGVLEDGAVDQPIAGRTVAIAVEGPNGYYLEARPSGPDGRFRWQVPLPLGQYTLRLSAGGDDDYARAPDVVRSIDLARRSPTLSLTAPASASTADHAVPMVVEARDPEGDLDAPLGVSSAAPDGLDGGRPVELPIVLTVDGRELARLRTRDGRAETEVPIEALGRPGALALVRARFAGDAERNPAVAERSICFTTPTRLTLAADGSELAWDGTLGLSGTLADGAGPLASATVTFWVSAPGEEGHEVARALTDAKGRFRVRLGRGHERPGARFVEARFQPTTSYREPSRSPVVPFTLLPPEARPIFFYLPPLLLLFGLGALVSLRKRPLRLLAERRQARRAREIARAAAGLSEARPRRFSTLRAAADFGLSGQVCELPSGLPLPTATVTVTVGADRRAIAVDEEGRFVLERLPAGPLEVEVSAPGFVSERFTRALPHRGELRGARVLLVPIRARIFEVYRELARRLLPSAVETWTPRELLHQIERRALFVEDLAELTALVEVACFGPRLPSSAELGEAERLAARVAAENAPPAARG